MANPEVAALSGLRSVTLAGAADFEGFRRACRTLWAEQIEPDRVSWHTADDAEGDLFEDSAPNARGTPATASTAPPVNVPANYMPLAASVALHAASACSIACCGACRSSPACATTRSMQTGCMPSTWPRPYVATCTR